MPPSPALRLGTRSSALARWQAQWVANQLRELGVTVELVPITTRGDQRSAPIPRLGAPGVFTKELQRALLDRQIDLAVHSLKDLPTETVQGLSLAAIPQRESPADAMVSNVADSLDHLREGATVGTGSLRRRAQLLHARGDLDPRDIRGNVDTRLKKLDRGEFDAIILAEAGLQRLELAGRITQVLPPEVMLPAVGQGALALETRSDDHATSGIVKQLDHPATRAAVLAERAMLSALQGGCLAPIAALAKVEKGISPICAKHPSGRSGKLDLSPFRLTLAGRVLSSNGVEKVEVTRSGPASDPEQLGRLVASALLAQGAGELIARSRA